MLISEFSKDLVTDSTAFTPEPDTVSTVFLISDSIEEMGSYVVVPSELNDPPPTVTLVNSLETKQVTKTVITTGNSTAVVKELEIQVPQATKVYFRRWFILGLFVIHSMTNAFHWIEYSIITNIIMHYYGVDSNAVNWLSMIYMVVYIPFIFPAAWLLDKKGLRVAVLLGSFGTALGSWIKVIAVSPDRFYLAMVGQSICALSQLFILGIPPRLAAVWFGPEQVSSATAIGVFGNQFGVALGFMLPPVLVGAYESIDEIGNDMRVMMYGTAGVCTLIFLAIIFVFPAQPPLPPSIARANLLSQEPDSYAKSILRILKNRSYVLLLISYGINVGVFYAISTLLNQIVLVYFPGQERNAGLIGLTIVVAGMAGSVMCGIILDKTHRFKETTLAVYALSLAGMVTYTFTLSVGTVWVVFLTAGLLGFFMTGYLPVGFEFAAELTYPEPEGTTSGLLNASAQLFGIIFTSVSGVLLDSHGDLVSNLSQAGALLVGTIITAFIKSDLRRQKAQKQPTVAQP